MSRPEEEKSLAWDLDELLTELKFGRYQIINLGLVGMIMMFSNLFPLSFTLTAGDVDYRCLVPECDSKNSTLLKYEPVWLPNAVPYHESKPRKCLRYRPLKNASQSDKMECSANLFDRTSTETCSEWVYSGNEQTIVREFNIMCENTKWELSLIGTVNNVGQFLGIPMFGIISDRYGRKTVALWCCILSAIFGILRGLSTSYLMFITFEFMDSFFGSAIYGAAFILGIELVNPKMRPLAATIIGVFYPIGAMIMGCVYWYFQDWRKLLLICYTPGLLFILYFWLIPESLRWLQMHGRYAEAFKILKSISRVNNVPLSEEVFELQRESLEHEMKNKKDEDAEPFWKPLLTAIESKPIFLRLINCSFSWFSNILVYYGLSINSVELVGNRYLNFILSNAVEIPAFILSGVIMNKVERRVSQSAAFFFSGMACIACEFIPADMFLLQIVLFLISKFLITISYNIIYIYSAEMFPTELRLSLCGFASMFGRIGSMIAPQTVLLRDVVGKHAPVLLFGVISLIAGGLATFFPETYNKKLPDTMNEAKIIQDEDL